MRSPTLMHIDMDAFYASVVIRNRPELRDLPVIIGGGHRGVVLSPNYRARSFGVRSGMAMTQARRRCPAAVIIAPDYAEFSTVSASVMELLRATTPVVEVVGLDEAFIDVRGVAPDTSVTMQAHRIRAQIYDEQRISCSVGIAPSLSVAKLASRRAKPDGVVEVRHGEVAAFLHPLDVGELYGVGEKTQAQLHRLGIHTVGELAHLPVPILRKAMGNHTGRHLHDLAWGKDRAELNQRSGAEAPEKSMGADETFGRDTDDPEFIRREFLRLTAKVAGRMRAAEVAGRTVTIRIRFADFTTRTRARTIPEATDVTQEIYRVVVQLYESWGLRRARLRLVGVRVEGLVPRTSVYRQQLLGERERGWAEADRAMDRALSRFGSAAIRPASLVNTTRR